jgi:hypothetical protein
MRLEEGLDVPVRFNVRPHTTTEAWLKLEELAPDERFITSYTRRQGEVVSQGPGGTMVKWSATAGTKEITRKPKWGSKQSAVTYTVKVPARQEVISGATEVERIGG